MRSITTLETKKHGDSLFPFASYRVKYPPNTVILDLHWHSELEFLIVTQGEGVFKIDDEEIIVKTGQGIIIKEGQLHSGYSQRDSGCTFLALVFDPEIIMGRSNDRVRIKYLEPVIQDLGYISNLLDPKNTLAGEVINEICLLGEIDLKKLPMYEIEIKIKLLKIFSLLYSLCNERVKELKDSAGDKSRNIKEALLYINKNYNRDLTLGEIARVSGMSEAYFSRTFKEIVNKTVFEYINYYRIQCSVSLLKETTLPISIISEKVGFESCSYFIKRFKTLLNKTPGSFRNKGEID